jgi:uncharacterized protein (TIGR00255 family)
MTLRSMTGYGRAEEHTAELSLTVELRSVNNRYLDLSWKIPATYFKYEVEFAQLARQYVKRGRIDILIDRKVRTSNGQSVSINSALIDGVLQEIKSKYQISDDPVQLAPILSALLTRREIIEFQNNDELQPNEIETIKKLLELAFNNLTAMRAGEGARLQLDLLQRVDNLILILKKVALNTIPTQELYQTKLRERLSQLAAQIDQQRLEQELLYFAERIDISEELVRLESHYQELQGLLKSDSNGRKLDFLLQEISREVNTIGSKSQNVEISSDVVAMKLELERIREQIQNIE